LKMRHLSTRYDNTAESFHCICNTAAILTRMRHLST
jgi:hypothetical protein